MMCGRQAWIVRQFPVRFTFSGAAGVSGPTWRSAPGDPDARVGDDDVDPARLLDDPGDRVVDLPWIVMSQVRGRRRRRAAAPGRRRR